MHFSRLNGVTLHYQLIGATEGKPTVVFINSLGTDFRIWRDVVVRLVGEVGIILYDKRGHGLSEVGATPYSIDDHAGDLEALLDHLGVTSAIVCGLSVGGLIALGLRARRPDLVRALVFSNTAHKIGTKESWAERISSIERDGIEAIADATMQRWFTPAFREAEQATLTGYRNMLTRQPLAGYVATCTAISNADHTETAATISVPTLCIAGDQDGATPPDLVLSLARLVPNARYELIAGSGHIPCVEQPEVFSTLVRAFLAELPHSPRGQG